MTREFMMSIKKLNLIIIINMFCILFATIASANENKGVDEVSATIKDQTGWRVIVSPYIWAASLHGESIIKGSRTNVDVPFSENRKNVDFSLMGNIELRNDQYGMFLDGQYTKTSQYKKLRNNRIDLNITSKILSGGVFYRAYEKKLGGMTVFDRPRVFAIEPMAGLRWVTLKAKVKFAGYSLPQKANWTDPFIGARFTYDINDRWNISALTDVGGFGIGTKFSSNNQIYLGYRKLIFNHPTTWRIGYRILYQDYRNDDKRFKYNVTQHGFVAGFSFQL